MAGSVMGEVALKTVDVLEQFLPLWLQANDNEQVFIAEKILGKSDLVAAKAAGVDVTLPYKWRKRHAYFPQLEQLIKQHPDEAAMCFMGRNLPVAALVQYKAMTESSNEANRLKAAKDTQDVAVKLAFLQETQKVHEKISISTKKAYD